MRRSAMLATAIAGTALALTAFTDAAGAGETLTKQRFLKAANATCKDAYRAIDAAFEEQFADLGENEPSAAQIEAGVASVVEVLRAAVADVDALVGPAPLERKVGRFLDQFGAVLAEFEADPQGAYAEELSGYPFAKPDKLARKIGLRSCAQRQR